MSYDDLQAVWHSPHNQPNAAALAELHRKFSHELRRRRRGLALFLACVCATLGATTVRLIWFICTTDAANGGVDFSREWGAVPFLLLPWIAVGALLVALVRHRSRHPAPEGSIAAAVRALLDENRLARVRYRTIAWLHGTLMLLVPLVVLQLRAVGKAGHEILVPAFVLWPLLAAAILGGMTWHHRRRLVPRQRELEALLRDYETT